MKARLFSVEFWAAAGERAIRTVAQTFIASVPSAALTLGDVPWVLVLSASALAGVLSLANSVVTGLPEA